MTPPPAQTPQSKRRSTKAKRKRGSKPDDATRMAKAMSHPLRARVLNRMNEGVASPVELAKEFGEPLGNVSYHVRALLDLECIELVKTAPRRGALEHYYRATRRAIAEDTTWEQLSPKARRGFAREWFNKTFSDASAAIEDGGFERADDVHLSFTRLTLNERGWSELSGLLREVYERAIELQAEAAELQAGGDGGQEMSARLVMAQYEAPGAKRRKTTAG